MGGTDTEEPMSTLKFLTLAAVTALVIAVFGSTPLAAAPTCTSEQGQASIEAGRYDQAVREFTCVIEAQPTAVDGYRGRIEARLLLGRYSDALGDYARITAFVEPVHPDAHEIIRAGYAARLAISPHDIVALTGASFERWANFDYAQAIQLLNQLLAVRPNDPYGTLVRGSSRVLQGGPGPKERGAGDLERAIALAPTSPDVRFVVADAYTYGSPDLERAFAEATMALNWGSTPHASRRSSLRRTPRSATRWPRLTTSRHTSTR
jgi:tetratricopeptide (TPR) repeat protein